MPYSWLRTTGPKITAPPRNCGERKLPWRARPVPFCFHGFLVVPWISLMPLVAWVPARRLALKSALSAKQADGKLVVLDSAKMKDAKTKGLAQRFAKLGWRSVLIIDGPEVDEGFARAARNLHNVDVLPQQGVNVYDIMRRDTLVLTRDAVQHLEARLK